MRPLGWALIHLTDVFIKRGSLEADSNTGRISYELEDRIYRKAWNRSFLHVPPSEEQTLPTP